MCRRARRAAEREARKAARERGPSVASTAAKYQIRVQLSAEQLLSFPEDIGDWSDADYDRFARLTTFRESRDEHGAWLPLPGCSAAV
jgi:hypothetical protein